jgi:hypothetical protein
MSPSYSRPIWKPLLHGVNYRVAPNKNGTLILVLSAARVSVSNLFDTIIQEQL